MALIQTLILKEQKSNDELQEELKEMANVCKEAYNGLSFYRIFECVLLKLQIA